MLALSLTACKKEKERKREDNILLEYQDKTVNKAKDFFEKGSKKQSERLESAQ